MEVLEIKVNNKKVEEKKQPVSFLCEVKNSDFEHPVHHKINQIRKLMIKIMAVFFINMS